MDKIKLNDETMLEFSKIEDLGITFADKTIEELEKVFTKENCKQIQLLTNTDEVYGIYNNLECVSITKNLEDNTVTVNLNKLDDLQVQVDDLQATADDLVMSSL